MGTLNKIFLMRQSHYQAVACLLTIRFTRFTAFCLATEVVPPVSLAFALYRGWQQGFNETALGAFVVMSALTLLGIEVGFHRHFAHRAFQAHPATTFERLTQ